MKLEEHIGRYSLQVQVLIIIIFVLNGCTYQQSSKQSSFQKVNSLQASSLPSDKIHNTLKLPMPISKSTFSKACGWLSEYQILYIANEEHQYHLYSYNLNSGKSRLLFQSKEPIGTVQISPSQKYIMIQSSPSALEGKMTIMDANGKVLYSKSFPSFQLTFEWNPYNDAELLLTKFNEDWTYKVYLVNLAHPSMNEISAEQPFLKWISSNQLAFINWDQKKDLVAPVVAMSLADGKEHQLFANVFQYATFKNMMMTITENQKDPTKATYAFFAQNGRSIFSFQIPQLKNFSGWLVPYYAVNQREEQFITFRPLTGGDADTYKGSFQLVLYNLQNGKNTILMPGLNNEPLSLAPSGNLCLYGNSLEKLIDLSTKKLIDLVKG